MAGFDKFSVVTRLVAGQIKLPFSSEVELGRCPTFDLEEIFSLKMEETHNSALGMTLLNT